jgi:protein TonB
MPTPTTNWTRTKPSSATSGADLALSLGFHAAIAGALFGLALLHPRSKPWGDQSPTAGAIQATMTDSIPLPPRQPIDDKSVLASETPSPAPVVAKETTPPPPSPKDIPVVVKQPPKPTRPVKEAPPVEAVKHPVPTPPPPTKAATGDTSGMRLAQSTIQMKNGSAPANVQDRSFGAHFAYYVAAVNRRVTQNWFTQEADPRASEGKHAIVLFDIDRDGIPSNVRLEARSGSPSLDTSAIRAVQRVDSFGPLPQGDHITVEFTFDYKQ